MKDIKSAVIRILQDRLMKSFNNDYHKHEFDRLNKAIGSITELVPPEQFDKIIEYID